MYILWDRINQSDSNISKVIGEAGLLGINVTSPYTNDTDEATLVHNYVHIRGCPSVTQADGESGSEMTFKNVT